MCRRIGIGNGWLWMALLACWSYQSGTAASADAISDVVARVTGEEIRWERRARGERCHRDVVVLTGRQCHAYVDRATGLLVGFWDGRGVRHGSGRPEIDMDTARSRAVAAIRRAGITLGEPWVQTVEERQDHGSAGQEYVFEWRKFLHGVHLPSSVEVRIDCHTGKVCGFYLYDDPVVVPIAARLTAAEAARLLSQEAARLLARMGKAGACTLLSAELCVGAFRGHPSPQAVFWEVTLQEAATGRPILGRVHANSGEVTGVAIAALMAAPPGTKWVPESRMGRLRCPPLDLRAAARAKIPPTVFELAARRAKMRRGSPAPSRRGGAAHAPAM